MATIRNDLVGSAVAINAVNEYQLLTASQTIPADFWVGGHLVQGGDADEQTPPWRIPAEVTVTSAQITDATDVGIAVLTAADEAAGRTAINAAEDA